MSLTETERAIAQAELTELQSARLKYLTGKLGVSVSYDGYSVTLNRTNIGLIQSRIRELKTLLGQAVGRRSFGTCY